MVKPINCLYVSSCGNIITFFVFYSIRVKKASLPTDGLSTLQEYNLFTASFFISFTGLLVYKDDTPNYIKN